jgi:hypothetical protein
MPEMWPGLCATCPRMWGLQSSPSSNVADNDNLANWHGILANV